MRSLLLHVAFVMALLGSKIALGLWAIYYLLPSGAVCPECDSRTFLIRMGASHRLLGGIFFLGRVRRRWCPECLWDGWARPGESAVRASSPLPQRDAADRPI